DCSTDGTQKYLEQLAKEDSRVRYFFKEKNSGACVSRNIAIEHSTGEYITGLDDDDYFLESRIKDFISYNPQNRILFSSIKKIGTDKIYRKVKSRKKKVSCSDLFYNNYIGNQVFVRSSLLKECDFDKNMKVWQDLECWFNLCSKYGFAELINNYSYVMDISHESPRISTSKKNAIKESFEYFCKKHSLDEFQKKILYTHIYNYFPEEISIRVLIIKLVRGFNLYDLKKILKKIIGIIWNGFD
ncbi:MAG: glycosyltransferase, partial [Malacoplasma sp.]